MYPANDSDETWHDHGDDTWEWGINCANCRKERTGHLGAPSLPLFALHHLSRQNREGVTTAEEVRDVLSNVKPEDRDKIARAN